MLRAIIRKREDYTLVMHGYTRKDQTRDWSPLLIHDKTGAAASKALEASELSATHWPLKW